MLLSVKYLNGTAMTKVMAGSMLLRAHAIVGEENLSPTKYKIWLDVALRDMQHRQIRELRAPQLWQARLTRRLSTGIFGKGLCL